MESAMHDGLLVKPDELILVTGSTGFIGSRLLKNLVDRGFRNLRCFTRPSCYNGKFDALASLQRNGAQIQVMRGNLLSTDDCSAATRDVGLIYHLAAGRGEKSYPDAYMNSVVTTRNLIEGCLQHKSLKRIVNISSFVVYTNKCKKHGGILDETCPVESHPERRGDAYCFAKVAQEDILASYGKRYGVPYVTVRPGVVYGPGNLAITGRVGIGSFGVFLHLGGSNRIPLSYVDNCVEAIALAGLKRGIDGEIFNVVDDELPTSRQFLRLYKTHVRRFRSIYVPHSLSYGLCYLWEKYHDWSMGQLPNTYNLNKWHSLWKKTRYSNKKLKEKLGWAQKVSTAEGLTNYFEACRAKEQSA